MAYATGSDLVKRVDSNEVKDLASDTGTPVSDVDADANISALLAGASGRVDAACLNAATYTTAQLAALTGNSLELLKDIVSALAMRRLIGRRIGRYANENAVKMIEESQVFLTQMRKGERLFDVDVVIAATKPTVDGLTVSDYNTQNLIPDRTRNYYPQRGSRLPIGR